MRNIKILTLLLMVLTLGMTGCTHNNGDIGPLFGNWQLTSLESDVPEIKMTPGITYYWAFQSSTISMNSVHDHVSDMRFGNYRLVDNTLFLDFSWTDPQGLPLFNLPRQCEMQLIELKEKRLVVQYHPTTTETVTFTFRKW